jgi:hypothetical protein
MIYGAAGMLNKLDPVLLMGFGLGYSRDGTICECV